jgi:hypothetical protein
MAWLAPKTNWTSSDGVRNTDLNRIEGNIQAVNTGTVKFCTTTNSGNTYTLSFTIPYTALEDGEPFIFKCNADSTGAASIKIDSMTAYPLKKANGDAMTVLKANGIYTIRWNATTSAFILQGEGGGGAVSQQYTVAGTYTYTVPGDAKKLLVVIEGATGGGGGGGGSMSTQMYFECGYPRYYGYALGGNGSPGTSGGVTSFGALLSVSAAAPGNGAVGSTGGTGYTNGGNGSQGLGGGGAGGAIGGGNGAGNVRNVLTQFSAGGGGGGHWPATISYGIFTVTPGTSYTVTVGNKGTGGAGGPGGSLAPGAGIQWASLDLPGANGQAGADGTVGKVTVCIYE